MTKVMSVLMLYFFIPSGVVAQGTLYRDAVFPGVEVRRDQGYRAPGPDGKTDKAHRFDLYLPAGASAVPGQGFSMAPRPLIIWMHGGGFKFGSKRAKGIRLWATSFARRGYVCAAINYRLSRENALGNFKDLVRGCAGAVEDAREAVRYFRAHAADWNIDTGRIILAGNSAGGIIALQAAYSTPAELARLSGDTATSVAGAGPAGSMSSGPSLRPGFRREKINAVINFWGALFDTAWLADARTPMVSVHGSKDHIVPAGTKGEHFFGSKAIHTAADRLSIPNSIRIYEGYGHELERHFNPLFTSHASKKRWLEAGQFAADFLYVTLFR